MRLDPDDWILKGIIDISTTVPQPMVFEIAGQYPNPFSDRSNLKLEINKRASVSVEIFNILGQKINTLHQGSLSVGQHDFYWNGDDASQREVPPGVYFFRIQHLELSKSVKILKLR